MTQKQSAPQGSPVGYPYGVPFVDHLGALMVEEGNGSSMLILDLRPEHRNAHGGAHGGVVMTLLDIAMARAVRGQTRHQGDPDIGVVTIEMKSSFYQPGRGDRLVARGTAVHRTTSMCFAEAELHDENGVMVARSSGTFKLLRPRPAAAPRPVK